MEGGATTGHGGDEEAKVSPTDEDVASLPIDGSTSDALMRSVRKRRQTANLGMGHWLRLGPADTFKSSSEEILLTKCGGTGFAVSVQCVFELVHNLHFLHCC